MPLPQSGTLSRLRDAFRLAFFLRVPETRLVPTWGEVVAAALLTTCAPTIYAFFYFGAEGQWTLAKLPEALLLLPVALVAATALGTLVRRTDAVPVLLFATLLAWIPIDTITLLLWAGSLLVDEAWVAPIEPLFFYLPLAWLSLAVTRFAVTVGPTQGLRQLAVLLASALLLAAPLAIFQPERSLWLRAPGDSPVEPPASIASEDALFRQPNLLAEQLEAIEPGRPGVIDVYFVGLAGYGAQDVFMREVDAVADIMRDRFDADGHIVRLVNNPRTVLTTPIASLTTLRAALHGVAQRMDRDEDVLVLFLTSHGSAGHKLELELGPMRFRDLDPPALRAALDESGIRNRVVVISACYSGGFVERLRDENTLVVTAAAADRTSFGCANGADWTYFGRAYFDEGLRDTGSFTRAFEMAAPRIEERERAERYEPSRPQMSAGRAIRARLALLEQQLDGTSLVASLRSH